MGSKTFRSLMIPQFEFYYTTQQVADLAMTPSR